MLVIPVPKVSVKKMRCSGGDDYFVSIVCDGREITPHVFKMRYKAEYEVAYWKHVFFGEPKPRILAFSEESHPNDPRTC